MGMIGMALAMALGGQAAADPPLQPTGKWTVEYAHSMCMLSRDYGTPAAPLTFALRPLPLGETSDVLLLSADAPGYKGTGKATVTFSPKGAGIDGTYIGNTIEKPKRRLTTITLKQNDLNDLGAASEIAIALDRKPPVRLVPQGIAAAMAALETCQRDLLKSWKIDPDEAAGIAKEAIPVTPQEQWITNSDYPASAIRADEQGTTIVLWTIGVDGENRDCRLIVSSGSAALDGTVCTAIIKRGRYHPAIGKDGKPVVSHKGRRVRWVMPS